MKHLFSILLALVLAAALASPARADIMWEPQNNRFYETHRSQCEYENRGYLANGEKGFVSLLDAPNGSQVLAQYENGEKLWVYFIYQDRWALTCTWDGSRKEISGWIPLGELSLVYDYQSFAEEYADRIRPYAGEFAGYDGDAAEVRFYEYPGAAESKQTWETSGDWHVLDNLTGTAEQDSYISQVFTDEDGRTWGYVGYMYGHLDGWFCLDQPDGTDFPLRDTAQPELIPAQTPTPPASAYTPLILVVAVVTATGGLLAGLYGKKRKKPTE